MLHKKTAVSGLWLHVRRQQLHANIPPSRYQVAAIARLSLLEKSKKYRCEIGLGISRNCRDRRNNVGAKLKVGGRSRDLEFSKRSNSFELSEYVAFGTRHEGTIRWNHVRHLDRLRRRRRCHLWDVLIWRKNQSHSNGFHRFDHYRRSWDESLRKLLERLFRILHLGHRASDIFSVAFFAEVDTGSSPKPQIDKSLSRGQCRRLEPRSARQFLMTNTTLTTFQSTAHGRHAKPMKPPHS